MHDHRVVVVGVEDDVVPHSQAMAAFTGGATGLTHWASEDVTVQGRDLNDINLVLRPGMTITATRPATITRPAISIRMPSSRSPMRASM